MTEPQLQQALDGIRLISNATNVPIGDILDALFFMDIIEIQDRLRISPNPHQHSPMTFDQLDRLTQAIEAIADITESPFDDILEALSDNDILPYASVVAIQKHRTS